MTTKTDKPKKAKKGLLLKALLGITLLGAGGGGAFGLMAAGVLGGGNGAEKPAGPQLVRKGEEDPYAPAETKEEGVPIVHGEGGSEYRTAYYSFGDAFTSNLRNSPALVQVSLAASTQRDGRVLMWLNEHQLALRSRILVELADTDEAEIATSEGKRALQKRLTNAINAELEAQEGFGGVQDVHFLSLIVQ